MAKKQRKQAKETIVFPQPDEAASEWINDESHANVGQVRTAHQGKGASQPERETVSSSDLSAETLVGEAKERPSLAEVEREVERIEEAQVRLADRALSLMTGLTDATFPEGQRDEAEKLIVRLRDVAFGMSDVIDLAEAAKLLKRSEIRVRQWAQENRLGRKVGTRYLFSKREVLAFTPNPTGRPPNES